MSTSNGITPEEKVRARRHTAHLNVAPAFAFVLGTPAGVQTQFAIESALDKVLVEAVPLFRQILTTLDGIQEQKFALAETAVAARVGSIELNADPLRTLNALYAEALGDLCNLLGIPANPFDKRGGGINVRVIA